MQIKNFYKRIVLVFVFLFSIMAYADSSPVAMLQNATDQMLSALKHTQNRNTQSLYSLVQRILLPHVSVDLMSQQVLGSYWAKATPQEKSEFKHEFIYFVTRTYSTALSSYSNQQVRYFPLRGPITGNRVQVNSVIDQQNGQNIGVSYRLIQSGDGWKVYDFSVEGVSLVANYHSQFAEVLRSQGLGGLIQKLKSQNAELRR